MPSIGALWCTPKEDSSLVYSTERGFLNETESAIQIFHLVSLKSYHSRKMSTTRISECRLLASPCTGEISSFLINYVDIYALCPSFEFNPFLNDPRESLAIKAAIESGSNGELRSNWWIPIPTFFTKKKRKKVRNALSAVLEFTSRFSRPQKGTDKSHLSFPVVKDAYNSQARIPNAHTSLAYV